MMLHGFLSFFSSKVGTGNVRSSCVATLTFVAAILLAFPHGARTQTIYTVTATTDTASVDTDQSDAIYNMPGLGPGSPGDLRYGIQHAIANGGEQTIEFNCGNPCTIMLNNPLPPITSSSGNPLVLTINGGHNGTVVIDGHSAYRVFFVDNATVTLANLVIQNAKAQGGSGGSASLSTFTTDGGAGGGGMGAGAGLFVNQITAVVSVFNTSFNNCGAVGGAGGNVVMGSSPWNSGMGGGGGGGGGMAFAGGSGAGGYLYSGGGGGMLAAGTGTYIDYTMSGATEEPLNNDASGNSGSGGVGGGGGGAGGGNAPTAPSGGSFCCNNVTYSAIEPAVYGLGGSAADYEVRQGGTQGTATQGSSGNPGGPAWDPYFLSSAPMAYGSSSNGTGNPGIGVFTAGEQYGNAPAYTEYVGGDGGFGGGGGGGQSNSVWYICTNGNSYYCGGGNGGFGGGGGGGAYVGGNGGFGGGGGGYAANAPGKDANFTPATGGGGKSGSYQFYGGNSTSINFYAYWCNSGNETATAEFNTPGGGGAAAGPAIFVNKGNISIINSYATGNSATAGAGGTNAVDNWMHFPSDPTCTIAKLEAAGYTASSPGSADSTPFFNNTGKLNCSAAAFGPNSSALTAGSYSDESSTLHLNITGVPSTVTAGVSTNTITVTLQNSSNATVTGYTGLVTLTSTNTKFTASPNPVMLTCGVGSATFEMNEAGSGYTITAAPYDSNLPSPGQIQNATSGAITVNPAAASSLTASSGTPQSAVINASFGTALQATVTDAYGNPISGATVTFSVTPASNGASASLSAPASTNSAGQTTVNATANGIAGQYTVTAAMGSLTPAIFTLTNTKAAQSINFTAPTTPVSFGATPVTLVATASTPNSGNSITFSITGGTGAGTIAGNVLTVTQAGTFTIAANLAGNANYTAAPTVSWPLTVNKATVTITASSPTVNYGDKVPDIKTNYKGFKNGDDKSVLTTLPTCSTTYTTTSAAGSSPSTSCSGAVAANYTFNYVDGSVTVNQATVTITASSPTVNYGDKVPDIKTNYKGFKNGDDKSVLTTLPTCSTTYTTTSAAGSSPTTSCSGAVAANYTFNYVDGSVTVNQATVTITASSPTVNYGDKVPGIKTNYKGFKNGDDRIRTDDLADVHDHVHDNQPGRLIAFDKLLGRSGSQLHVQLCGRQRDGEPGDGDDHGIEPDGELRR
jgi:hypothetical protein